MGKVSEVILIMYSKVWETLSFSSLELISFL